MIQRDKVYKTTVGGKTVETNITDTDISVFYEPGNGYRCFPNDKDKNPKTSLCSNNLTTGFIDMDTPVTGTDKFTIMPDCVF